MRIHTSSPICAAILALLLGWHSYALGGIQASENFDSTNSWNLTWASYTNSATNATGWVVNNAKIEYDSTAPSPYFACRLHSTSNSLTTFITSPLLSNGVGYVVFKARLLQQGQTNQVLVESSSGDGNWTIRGQTNHLTSAYTNWNAFTNVVLIPTNQYVRLRKLSSGNSYNVFFDNISITYPPANISVTNLTTTPAVPKANDPFSVTAQLSFAGYPDTVVATNYWKLSSDSSWTAIPMITNQATVFTTVSNIPGQSAYSSVDYFVKVYQTTDISGSNTVFFSQTNTLTFRPHSSYTNMVVTSPINASLIPFANYLWQGVGYVSNSVSVFKYQGDSNGVMTLWGDSNQSASNLMAYGNADVGATNIILSTTNIGPHVFTFNETNGAYMVRSCVYENFETWSNQPFGTNTNTWTLSDGAVTNDAAGAFLGHYAILNGQPGASTNAYLRSPLLTNGVGDISFWYRKWGTNGAPSGSLTVQIASNPASTGWTTIATISNITQTTYSFVNIPWSDLNNQAVRILNNASGSNSRVSLDEVVVAAPGAAVRSANLATVPATPGILDAVNIGIDLIPNAFATITNVVLWYRGSDTNLLYQSQPMILSNANHFVTTNGIPPSYGAVYYAVQYFFTGIMGQSPVFVPSAGTNSLNSYTPTNTLPANYYRYETFDSTNSWNLTWANYTNSATNATGWVVNNARIETDPTAPSQYFACRLNSQSDSLTTFITSPLLSNGVGSVVFKARLFQGNATNQIVVESSSGDGNWTIQGQTNYLSTSANTNWNAFTNVVLIPTNQYVRLRKLTSGQNCNVFFDNILCTPYPAYVAVTNVNLNPGYPVVGQSASVSCDIPSLNYEYPAFDITPILYWSLQGGVTSSIPMTCISGNTYSNAYPMLFTNATRDLPFSYWIRADFAGYRLSDFENQSPRYSLTNNMIVRALSSTFSNIIGTVNGSNFVGRLVSNSVWQTVFTTPPTNSLAFSFTGNGYSVGAGYATNATQWGNTNTWQTAFPLADTADTGQTAFVISGSSNAFSGQYVIRFDETTRQYLVVRCVWQNFDQGSGSGTPYIQDNVSATNSGVSVNFSDWTPNISQVRRETFSDPAWTNLTTYLSYGNYGSIDYCSYGMIYTNVGGTPLLLTKPTVAAPDDAFVGQGSDWDPQPSLRGIDTITAKIRTVPSNTAALAIYLMPTNGVTQPSHFNNYPSWIKPPLASWSGISNAVTPTNLVITLRTNATLDVIFSATQTMYIAELSVSEWYAADNTNNGWTAYQSWITNGACLFQASRSAAGAEQYLLSPAISSGVSTISFDYSSPTTTPTSLSLDISYSASPFSWSNLVTINNALFNGSGTDFSNRQYALLSTASPIYFRVKNLTPSSGGLIIDNVQISGFASSNDWYMNSAAIKWQPQSAPPASRQYYQGAGYLNSNRTSEISAQPELKPSTNVYPCIRTPSLANGIGEISFWYRNWAAGSTPAPARLLIQKSMTGNASTSDWSYVDAITNIVNTNDYVFYQASLYDTNNRYIRIVNDDTYSTTGVGRVCLDDILVTEPWATRLSLSNLVTTPTIPLYSNEVTVAVDVYNLFYNPSGLALTTYYGTASSYTGLASAILTALPMTCISSNLTVPGKSYRYQTQQPIPTNASDTFVKYYVKASYSGYHTEVSSPLTNKQFTVYPSWLYPLNSVNGTNQAYYVVFSCPTGSVWINEFNIADWSYGSTYQFLELCGKSGVDIRNWSLQILNSTATTQAVYSITNSTTFNNTTNGFGFWVIGKTAVSGRQQTLTNDLPTSGGFRLSRPSGVTVDSVCYTINALPSSGVSALLNKGFIFAGQEDDWYDTSVILVGSNTNGLSWTLGNDTYFSPGQINDGEILVGIVSESSTPPVFGIYSVWLNTNVWIECSGTNTWAPAPWYSTNLLKTNGWVTITPFASTYPTLSPSNTYTINFPKGGFTNSPAYFFKVVVTNVP